MEITHSGEHLLDDLPREANLSFNGKYANVANRCSVTIHFG